ncbi:MAG: hypothetical protein ACRETO_04860 [Gammaproteobacteria bacterium]
MNRLTDWTDAIIAVVVSDHFGALAQMAGTPFFTLLNTTVESDGVKKIFANLAIIKRNGD